MKNVNVTVIVSTYNMIDWLEKVLWGYSIQTYKHFDILIADDGSGEETKSLIDRFKKDYPVNITHLWHEDKGYRRQELLNKAMVEANGDYIIMTDGDCIPREDFVEVHAKLAQEGKYLAGGYCKLGMELSKSISKEDILNKNCFKFKWLKSNEKLGLSNTLKIASSTSIENFLDKFTPTNTGFSNCNSSGWKKDFIMINGYDERMQYGGPDREFGERLVNGGIAGKQIRHKAIVLHLDHSRGYKNKESTDRNMAIREFNKKNKIVQTAFGIEKLNPAKQQD